MWSRRWVSFARALPARLLGSWERARCPALLSASRCAVLAMRSHRPALAKVIRPRTTSLRVASRAAGGVCAGKPPAGAQRSHRPKHWMLIQRTASSSLSAGQVLSSAPRFAKRSPSCHEVPPGSLRKVGSGVCKASGDPAAPKCPSPSSQSGKRRGPGAQLPSALRKSLRGSPWCSSFPAAPVSPRKPPACPPLATPAPNPAASPAASVPPGPPKAGALRRAANPPAKVVSHRHTRLAP